MNDRDIGDLIGSLAHHMKTLSTLLTEPSTLPFHDVEQHFPLLEEALALKPGIDAAFAYAAELHSAGRKVGSTQTADYLATTLGISRAEARRRVQRGRDLFDPAPEPPEDSNQPDPEAAEQKRKKREKNEQARKKSRQQQGISDEKRAIIDAELKHLFEGSEPSLDELRALALIEAAVLTPEDLRHWLRQQVREANKTARAKDPAVTYGKRSFWIGKQQGDGMVRFGGTLPAEMAAILAAAFSLRKLDAASRSQGVNPDDDDRTITQKRADLLIDYISSAGKSDVQKRTGMGSVVISMTIDDILEMDAHSSFPTNVGIDLDPAELHRLGAAISDFFVLHDRQGKPLAVGRGSRSATLEQRIALFAWQLVCQTEGCDVPAEDSDAHHNHPWADGGETDIDNLTLMCPGDHRDNNDKRDGSGNMGHMEYDPETSRPGHRKARADKLTFNDSPQARRAAGWKLRKRGKKTRR